MQDHSVEHPPRRPLFVTADPAVAAALRKLAAAAGTSALHTSDAENARQHWSPATSIVVGADRAHDCAAAGLPRRGDVILLAGRQLPYAQAWPLASKIGADTVADLPAAAAWLTNRLAPAPAAHAVAPMIAVTGARGGVGASVLSAGLALAATGEGRRVLLIDGDAAGGGLDVVLGWEHRKGLRWRDVAAAEGPFDPDTLAHDLPQEDGLSVLSFDREPAGQPAPTAVREAIEAARRGSDLVVVDMPRSGAAWLQGCLDAVDLSILVVPAEVRAVAAARRLLGELTEWSRCVRLAVRVPSPGKLRVSDVAAAVGRPSAARLHCEPKLRASVETSGVSHRDVRGRLAETAQEILTCLQEAVPAGDCR